MSSFRGHGKGVKGALVRSLVVSASQWPSHHPTVFYYEKCVIPPCC